MLARASFLVRLLALGLLVVSPLLLLRPQLAAAEDEEEEDDEGGDGEGEDEDGDAEDKDQPKVTAGGLYVLETYPVTEAERPLTMTEKILEARVGLTFDLSKGQTFKTWFLDPFVRYGIKDNLEVHGGASFMIVTPEGVEGRHSVTLGGEVAIVYDLVDFRLDTIIGFGGGGDTTFDIAFGFPFRYNFQGKVAIVALDKLFTIHTQEQVCISDPTSLCSAPDLTIGLSGIFQAAPMFALIAHVEIVFPQFETEEFLAPASLAAQYTPSSRIDIGLAIKLLNLNQKALPEGGMVGDLERVPVDGRALELFARARF